MQKTVTEELVLSKIKEEQYFNNGKTTVCILVLKNGFNVVGTSGVVDVDFFNEDLGKKYAKQKALEKVWELEAYLLQEEMQN